ncbi:hypothetical protein NX722_02820 [Endozoicomonas gorgoniicola]|uniref:GRAM domain-containing protein n=1 Tax=Endozoicomonas gorgoniicola TaxID=1234144 RepID=A0ABT3MRB0_9GAMM|nr:hypothetical protein [Endozoicomonas gorgoniicola]MCW7551594.1 hypothetical protein [Endozoicomonas gorgoniicola]
MKVKINSKKKILKSFLGWLPLTLVTIPFYFIFFTGGMMWLLQTLTAIGEEEIKKIALLFGVSFIFIGGFGYINWLTKSLSSYKLSLKNDVLAVCGKSGWGKLNIKIPANTVKEINLGQKANTLEKLSSGNGLIQDQVSSRLTFLKTDGSSFKLDFASKAFDIESLCEFLIFIKSKDIDSNIERA